MRVVIQRVRKASVIIGEDVHAQIGKGLLVFLGIEVDDNLDDVVWLSGKIINLRIFDDENGIMNHSVLETRGNILLVSQFTLHASTKKGNRPSYVKAGKPEVALPLYEFAINKFSEDLKKNIQTGVFGAEMKIELVNDGPVTIILDSKNKE